MRQKSIKCHKSLAVNQKTTKCGYFHSQLVIRFQTDNDLSTFTDTVIL